MKEDTTYDSDPGNKLMGLRAMKDRQFLTEWAHVQIGSQHQDESLEIPRLADAIIVTHDLFLLASRKPYLSAQIVCSSLSHALREELWKQFAPISFGQSLREFLSAGGSVKILLANAPLADEPMSQDVLSLGVDFPGQFSVRSTGRPDFLPNFPHFILLSGDDDGASSANTIAYVEKSHPPLAPYVAMLNASVSVSAFVVGEGRRSSQMVSLLRSQFDQLFGAVGQEMYYALAV